MPDWLREAPDGSLFLTLHVQPGAKRTGFAGLYGEAVKLRLAAPPVDGKANAALCAYLAEVCGAPKSAVSLIGGETSRAKRVRIEGGEGRAERLRAAATRSVFLAR
ncbi:MAG: DUF167 domain-containing protein [Azoarcus sp.]|jgi:uncharacterized protein (TIGR00251 family)|nr:DUF167 domain-containing protein [Azoarcus sp.]